MSFDPKSVQMQADAAIAQGREQHLKALARDGKTLTPEMARKVAEDFEAVFITQMVSYMFKGVRTDGMFQGGSAEKIWREQMFSEYGKHFAARGGFGIADLIEAQILGEGGDGGVRPIPKATSKAALNAYLSAPNTEEE